MHAFAFQQPFSSFFGSVLAFVLDRIFLFIVLFFQFLLTRSYLKIEI